MKIFAKAAAVALLTAGAVAVPLSAEAAATPLAGSIAAAPAFSPHDGGYYSDGYYSSYRRDDDMRRYRDDDRDYRGWGWGRNRSGYCDQYSGWDRYRYRSWHHNRHSNRWDCCRYWLR